MDGQDSPVQNQRKECPGESKSAAAALASIWQIKSTMKWGNSPRTKHTWAN